MKPLTAYLFLGGAILFGGMYIGKRDSYTSESIREKSYVENPAEIETRPIIRKKSAKQRIADAMGFYGSKQLYDAFDEATARDFEMLNEDSARNFEKSAESGKIAIERSGDLFRKDIEHQLDNINKAYDQRERMDALGRQIKDLERDGHYEEAYSKLKKVYDAKKAIQSSNKNSGRKSR